MSPNLSFPSLSSSFFLSNLELPPFRFFPKPVCHPFIQKTKLLISYVFEWTSLALRNFETLIFNNSFLESPVEDSSFFALSTGKDHVRLRLGALTLPLTPVFFPLSSSKEPLSGCKIRISNPRGFLFPVFSARTRSRASRNEIYPREIPFERRATTTIVQMVQCHNSSSRSATGTVLP